MIWPAASSERGISFESHSFLPIRLFPCKSRKNRRENRLRQFRVPALSRGFDSLHPLHCQSRTCTVVQEKCRKTSVFSNPFSGPVGAFDPQSSTISGGGVILETQATVLKLGTGTDLNPRNVGCEHRRRSGHSTSQTGGGSTRRQGRGFKTASVAAATTALEHTGV